MDKVEMQKRLGERIRRLREAAGFSQMELAERAALSRVHLSGLERGQSSPAAELLVRIAQALNIRLSELLDDLEPGASSSVPLPGYGIYPALQELLDDEEAHILYNITPNEIELLKSVRFQRQDWQPSKQFFLDVLLDLRRRRTRDSG